MAKLIILGEGSSEGERNNSKGKLFETLSKNILSGIGYDVTNITRVNYSGMEIDVEGVRIPDKTPFIGECKGWSTEIGTEQFVRFFGKYTAKWYKDKKLIGLFIALPNINSYARGFYNDNIKDNKEITFALIEEPQLFEHLYKSKEVISENTLFTVCSKLKYNLGDSELLYTKRGFFWVQYLLEKETLPSKIVFVNSKGEIVSDKDTIEYILDLYGQLKSYALVNSAIGYVQSIALEEEQEIVLIQGSKSCFEYQFPASPEFFFGREEQVIDCIKVIDNIRNAKSSAKGILILANSGWGKSSLILKLVDIAYKNNILVIPIDSRNATNQKFCLKAVDYAIKSSIDKKFLSNSYINYKIGGFNSLTEILKKISAELEKSKKSILIFFDQFENVFFRKDLLEKLYTLVSMLNVNTKNILLGFGWKSDLLSIAEEFPYELRDEIRKQCEVIKLPIFGENEITTILKALEGELKAPLKKELSRLIREHSQGYPWLLKKLCAHVIRQRGKGVKQVDLINSTLNARELFEQDLSELCPEEAEVLRNIAKRAPLSASEMPEGCPPELLRSLINKRLVVEIGHKFDICWDIFKDYLNTGKLPIEDSYILRLTPGGVLKALFKIREKKSLKTGVAHLDLGYKTRNTSYNVIRELRLLDLITYQGETITLCVNPGSSENEFDLIVKAHIKNKLKKHRIVASLLGVLEKKKQLTLDSFAQLLEKEYPYIKADTHTWWLYAKNFSTWGDCADLIIYDNKKKVVNIYNPDSEVRSKKSLFDITQKATNIAAYVPSIQYVPIEKAIVSIGDAIKNRRGIEVSTTMSSWKKALRDAMVLKFLVVEEDKIRLLPEGLLFYQNAEDRKQIFTRAVSNLEIYKDFSEIFKKSKGKLKGKELAKRLNKKLGGNWTKQTSLTVNKILINWSKVTGLYDSIKGNKK